MSKTRYEEIRIDEKSKRFIVTKEEEFPLDDVQDLKGVEGQLKKRLQNIVRDVKLLKQQAEDTLEQLQAIKEKMQEFERKEV